MIKVAVDAMGGDYAPEAMVQGAVAAINADKNLTVILTGDEGKINPVLAPLSFDKARLQVVHCTEVITNDDTPTLAIRSKKDSSLVVALRMLKDNDDVQAFVSAGSTGAVLTGATLRVGRIRGITRPAVCPALPTVTGGQVQLIDAGANADCKAINLCHFALMGAANAKAVGIENPRVGLLTNGSEDHKGDMLHQEAHQMLKKMTGINYVGNIEGRDIMGGEVDVVVCDGFSGNIALKTVEGTASAMMGIIKKNIKASLMAKIGYAFFMKKAFRNVKKALDYNQYGGAVLLGIEKVVVKAHGSSSANCIAAAIAQAKKAVESGLISSIKDSLQVLNAETDNAAE